MTKAEEKIKKAINNFDKLLEKQMAEADCSGNYAFDLLKKRRNGQTSKN